MNRNKILLLLSFMFLLGLNLHSQDIAIKGKVLDIESTEGLPGATLMVKGTSHGTITDFNGDFDLKVFKTNDTLEVTFIGYQTQEIALNNQSEIEISLALDNNKLDEVVVIGYGTQKKLEVTGATSRINAEEINATPILRVEQALQGRTAGVQVTNLSGQPGEEPTVRIRGVGTTGNARPLFIVDGMPVGGIDYLNPGDIESIDVLKDAASAAIYGARAANGVVLVTTKSGKKGGMLLSYDTYYGVQNVAKKIDMLDSDQYKMMMNEGARNAGLTEPFEDLLEISPTTDWQSALFGTNVPMQNHQLNVSGGNDKSTYTGSLSYFTQEGIIGGPKSQFDRYTARFNSRHKVNSVFRFGNNIAFSHLDIKGIESNQSFIGAFSSALNMDPLTPVYETDPGILAEYPYSDEPVVTDDAGSIYGISNYVGAEVVNPLALNQIDTDVTKKDEIVGSVYGEFEPVSGLKFRTTLGVDLAYLTNSGYRPLYFLNGAQLNVDKTSVNKHVERFYTWQMENTVSYEKQFNDHKFTALLGRTVSEYNYENLFGFNTDVSTADPNNVYLNLATDTLWNATGGAAHSALLSSFGRLNYNFKDKYSISTVLRRDGSSKFGANKRYGIFPSVGVAWVISNESFLGEDSFFDLLKLRASWGVNGNQEIGDYQFVSIIDRSRGYTFGGGRDVGASPQFIENADIRWEEAEQTNIGIDFGILNNRLQATMDFYVKTTSGLLERIPIPAHVGNDGPIANVGSVQNKGVELSLNWNHRINSWKYGIGVNGSFNKNEMTFIGNEEKVIIGASWAIAGAVTRSEEGLPISYFWGYKTDGIFQTQTEVFQHFNSEGELLQPKAVPGDVRFVDFNGDGVIDADDRTELGNPYPDFNLGLNGSLAYKEFDFSIFVQGTIGNEIFNGMQRQDLRFTNRDVGILERWTGEGTSNTIPRFTWNDINNNYRISDLYIEDGSYVRVKNIQIGYTFPKTWFKGKGFKKWRVYISGENLFTLTAYTGADPEIGAISSFDAGIDRAVYPQAKTVRFGTSVTF